MTVLEYRMEQLRAELAPLSYIGRGRIGRSKVSDRTTLRESYPRQVRCAPYAPGERFRAAPAWTVAGNNQSQA